MTKPIPLTFKLCPFCGKYIPKNVCRCPKCFEDLKEKPSHE